MKHVKKLLAVVLSAALAMAMCVSAFADAPEQKSITINNPDENTYTAYQVMTAEKKEGTNEYTYTLNENFAEFFESSSSLYGGYSWDAAQDLLTKGSTSLNNRGDGRNVYTNNDQENPKAGTANNNTSNVAKLAAALSRYVAKKPVTGTDLTNAEGKATGSFDLGYYLVRETKSAKTNSKGADNTDEVKDNTVASKPMLLDLTRGDATVDPKDDSITLDKVIEEYGQDCTENTVSIGDDVSYRIDTSFPVYQAPTDGEHYDLESLVFKLTDTFDTGLTYKELTSVKVDGQVVDSSNYTVNPETPSGQTFTITFNSDYIWANQGKPIEVKYKGTLNENAVINKAGGNKNTVVLDYSHNPNETDKVKTLKDEVTTYTYGVGIQKVDHVNPDEKLGGAEFTIEAVKKDDQGNPIQTGGKYETEKVWFKQDEHGVYYPVGYGDIQPTAGAVDHITTPKTGDNIGKVDVKGLDEGKYVITETVAPDRYTKLENPITITIAGDKDGETQKLTGKANISIDGDSANSKIVDEETGAETGGVSADDGTINLDVQVPNVEGTTLPETGSRTAMYCMIGGAVIVVLGAGYYLMGARRNKKEQ